MLANFSINNYKFYRYVLLGVGVILVIKLVTYIKSKRFWKKEPHQFKGGHERMHMSFFSFHEWLLNVRLVESHKVDYILLKMKGLAK